MKTKSNITAYIIHSIAAAVLILTAQVSLAGSATWLSSPQDSAWENANNWTPGGPPNAPSDIATFAQSSQRNINVSTSEEVNSIVFTAGSASYHFISIFGGQLIITGTGIHNNSSVLQTFETRNGGQIIFNNASTAASAHMSIVNGAFSADPFADRTGYTIFNDTSSAAGASIYNASAELGFPGTRSNILQRRIDCRPRLYQQLRRWQFTWQWRQDNFQWHIHCGQRFHR